MGTGTPIVVDAGPLGTPTSFCGVGWPEASTSVAAASQLAALAAPCALVNTGTSVKISDWSRVVSRSNLNVNSVLGWIVPRFWAIFVRAVVPVGGGSAAAASWSGNGADVP